MALTHTNCTKAFAERCGSDRKGLSQQVALLVAIGGCVSVYSENSRLKAKVHDLKLEVLPFRNLAVQQFNKADAEGLKKLAESMATLHKDYSAQLATINNLHTQIDQLKKANDETAAKLSKKAAEENFIPLSEDNKKQFVNELRQFFRLRPSITNLSLISDATEKRRRLWIEQMRTIISAAKLPVHVSGGVNMERGMYELAIFYRADYQWAAEEIAKPFTKLFQAPITISARSDQTEPLSVRFMGEPLFGTNGVIHFK